MDVGTFAPGLGRLGHAPRGELAARPVIARLVASYAGAGLLATGIAVWLGRSPVSCPGWLGTTGAASWLISVGLALPLAAATIASTPYLVRRSGWARALHGALRPAVNGASDRAVVIIALASAAGEELLFRGLLVPILGVIVSSVLFGALHQIRGRGRWGWMVWATLMGGILGVIYAATGNLAGPFVAHAAINGYNLRFLRDHDPSARPPALGGLLRR